MRKLLSLPLRESLVLFELWWTLAWLTLLVRALPYRGWRRIVMRATARATDTQTASDRTVRELVRLFVIAAANQPLRTTCLSRSLALWLAFSRRQMHATVHFGIDGGSQRRAAHAWLEYRANVVVATLDSRALYELRPRKRAPASQHGG